MNLVISTTSETISAGDLLDRQMDALRTIHMALSPDNKGWLDNDALLAIWATLDGTIRDLKPLREALQNPNDQPVRMVGGDRNG